MGRSGRMLVDGGLYHITNRGHNRYTIFNSEDDYKAYKDLIRDYKKKFAFDVFHYCFMRNHPHMLLKITKGLELPHIMQSINQAYSKHYKRQYRLIGNLFQGRYTSILIERDEYLMECGRYIERNPLRAGLVADLSRYRFSSYNFYINGVEDDIITSDPCYMALSKDPEERRRLYKEYVLQKRPYEIIVDKSLKI